MPFVLPYLEQEALHREYRLDVATQGWSHALNRPAVTQTHLKILQCLSARPDRLHVEAFLATAGNTPWGACIAYAAVKGVRTKR